MGETIEVTSSLECRRKIVEAGFTPVVVYFYANWAGPCQEINETVQRAVDNNDIRLIKVNADKALDFVDQCQVNTLPMFQCYFRGVRKRIFHSSSPPVFDHQLKDFLKNDLNKSTVPTHAGFTSHLAPQHTKSFVFISEAKKKMMEQIYGRESQITMNKHLHREKHYEENK